MAQIASDESLSGGRSLGAVVELVLIAAAGLGFLALFRLWPRWPQAERWLVVASLVLFAPAASYFLALLTGGSLVLWSRFPFLYVSGARISLGESFPALLLLTPVLGAAWWWARYRTGLLAPAPSGDRDVPAADASPPAPRSAIAPAPAAKVASAPKAAPPPTAAAPRPTAPAGRADAIFVSYRRQDSSDVTGRIYDRLVQRFGKDQVFKDVDSIPLGVDFREHLNSVVGRSSILLAVVGPQWLNASGPNGRRLDDAADFVRIEIEAALSRRIPVIPVLVGGAELPADSQLPNSIAAITYRNGIAVRPDPDFHRDMDRLISGIEAHLRV